MYSTTAMNILAMDKPSYIFTLDLHLVEKNSHKNTNNQESHAD